MIRVLTGPIHSGKTTRVKELVRDLKSKGIDMDGFLCEANAEGYDLFDLKHEKTFPFLRKDGDEQWQRTGSWYVIPQGLAEAEKIISRGAEAGLLVVDEIGPLEMKGGGYWPSLEPILPRANCLIVVQERILEHFLDKVKTCRVEVFRGTDEALSAKILDDRDD